jgi:hypothetical protein
MRSALDMHDLGVKLYQQRMRREHPVADLDALRVRWALIGGLAISVRSVPRFTKDLDFAVAVADDSEAEGVVHRLRGPRHAHPGSVRRGP